MWSDDGEPLDKAIDEVAREMTAGEPGGDFRARVIARIETSPRRRWWLAAVAVPAGALAIAIAIALYPREEAAGPKVQTARTTPTADTTVPGLDTTVRRPGPSGPGEAVQPVRAAQHAQAGVTRPPRNVPGPRPGEPGAPSEIDPLALTPLTVDSLRLAALPAADSIALTPLETIAPIAVTPLGSDEQGDRP